jgi:hypothetical protein
MAIVNVGVGVEEEACTKYNKACANTRNRISESIVHKYIS